jgi:hypothetical protein
MVRVGNITIYLDFPALIKAIFDAIAIATTKPLGLADLQKVVDIAQKLFTIAAIIVGGVWTYFHFFKGRTFKMRLEPSVSSVITTSDGTNHLIVSISLRNVGLSKVEIEQKGSVLQVLSYEAPIRMTSIESASWKDLKVFPVFESQEWIEPGELVEEQRLLVTPDGTYKAFRLQLRIVSKGSTWNAMHTIVLDKDDPDDNDFAGERREMAEEQKPGIHRGPDELPSGAINQQYEDLQQALLASHVEDIKNEDDPSKWITNPQREPQQAKEDPAETDRLESAKLAEKRETELRSNWELINYMLETGKFEELNRLTSKADQANTEDKASAYAEVNKFLIRQMKNLLEDPSREEKKARRSSPYWS